ncbi:hypothetical protein NIES2135_38690 [Leptolyngbya boryana NIES-2135]|uniref:Uncharacterized protein n=1 Tax=Leptolyngbya boryana NIES-2135 TaxID=1973484 RepID=A0A1Z4JJV4_LEPBY|nr:MULTISPECIES: hypothetical protein [Leptolyngbya]BAY57006.1 hypothetical protein NIES2135_38690 [Leptolyngbya boryana NIES-2135]MBD2371378.1 hypothetical protein [Leptolyngbya sp. FACHB-161]MBD2377881.1 hypothetical protein [Leptolyngbya sp. FACHB-238]MBD2402321.1 hypothetical protein [Leptolyngbya sp. FACHB-239]MBD2408812.1 hypothetical protein [Leptolyngbya sp. FACHB-402]
MTDQNSAAVDQNSTTEMQYRPDEVQREFDIKSAQYYERLKFLGIKAHKDEKGKAYLDQSQFDRMKRLDQHIRETGEMDGSIDSEGGELAPVNPTNLAAVEGSDLAEPIPAVEEPTIENGLGKQIFRAAAELKASELAMIPQVVREVANRMTKDDLPEDLKAQVERTEEATRPNFHPSAIADKLLDQMRQSRQTAA